MDYVSLCPENKRREYYETLYSVSRNFSRALKQKQIEKTH